MDVPATVQDALDGESVVAEVGLNGENALYVTPSRALYFRADGLLSDESVESYPHGAERISVSEGRRKATITLDYGTDGERSFSVPTGHVDRVIHPLLAGVLSAHGVTGPGETTSWTKRFSELTLVVTTERLVKHVGAATWDTDYEEIPYSEVRGLDVEDGAVAAQLVIETPRRVQRVKVPAEDAREVHERLESALLDYYEVDTYREFERVAAAQDPDTTVEPESEERADSTAAAFDSPGLDPIEPSRDEEETTAPDPGAPNVTGDSAGADAVDDGGAAGVDTADGDGGTTGTNSRAGNESGVGANGATNATPAAETRGEIEQAEQQSADAETPASSPGAPAEAERDTSEAPDREELAERIEELEELLARQEDLLAKQRAVLGELAAEVQSTPDR